MGSLFLFWNMHFYVGTLIFNKINHILDNMSHSAESCRKIHKKKTIKHLHDSCTWLIHSTSCATKYSTVQQQLPWSKDGCQYITGGSRLSMAISQNTMVSNCQATLCRWYVMIGLSGRISNGDSVVSVVELNSLPPCFKLLMAVSFKKAVSNAVKHTTYHAYDVHCAQENDHRI